MGYRIGDKVTIVSKEKLKEIYERDIEPGVVPDMYKYANKTVTISYCGSFYGVEENVWSWSEDMFEN
jgi:hypothetical protein